MAHEVESMAYANAVPWHGLGARIDESASTEEFLKAAGLDWQVRLCPLTADMDGEQIKVPSRFALIRETDKRILTVTGKSWKPLQNADTLDFMTRYVKAGGATMETAGALRGGKIVWGLAKLKHSFEVRPGDRVNGYLLITSPHEVGRAISIQTTTVRVVCANTMAYANSHADTTVNYKQNHLSEFDVEAAKEAVEAAHENLAQAERRARILDGLKLTAEDAVRKVLVPVWTPQIETDSEVIKNIMNADVMPKRIAEIMESVNNAPGAIPDTGWGVLNGVTHWVDHVQGRTADTRMYRSWIGDYSRMKIKTEDKLMELAA